VVDHVIIGRNRWISLRQTGGELWEAPLEVLQ